METNIKEKLDVFAMTIRQKEIIAEVLLEETKALKNSIYSLIEE